MKAMAGVLVVLALLLLIFIIAFCQEKHLFGWQLEEETSEGL